MIAGFCQDCGYLPCECGPVYEYSVTIGWCTQCNCFPCQCTGLSICTQCSCVPCQCGNQPDSPPTNEFPVYYWRSCSCRREEHIARLERHIERLEALLDEASG